MRKQLTRRTAAQLDRQSASPRPFSREWMNAPAEQRAIPQRATKRTLPAWLPSNRSLSIALVTFLVLFATLFQTRLSPNIASPEEIAGNGLPATSVSPTPDSANPASGGTPDPEPTATTAISNDPLLPENRIVAYYGHPNDEAMGILGQFSMDDLHQQLLEAASAYERADPDRPVIPAFELIASVAQGDPQADGSYLLQTDPDQIREYIEFTQANNLLLILDIQIGRTSVEDELALIEDYLAEPNVHLAIDPEFAMGPDQIPGIDIGSVDARDINYAQEELARIAAENDLPPKLLIVHRFTDGMITRPNRIADVEGVQTIIDVDGFGDPPSKTESYGLYARDGNVMFAGIKIFYDQDRPLMQPDEVLDLDPPPDFVMYQ